MKATLKGTIVTILPSNDNRLVTTFKLSENDKEIIKFCVSEKIDFIAMSFVGKAKDVFECKEYINA